MKTTYRRSKVIASIAATVLVATMVVQNTEAVEARVFFFTLSMPLGAWVFLTALIGIAVGFTIAMLLSGRGTTDRR